MHFRIIKQLLFCPNSSHSIALLCFLCWLIIWRLTWLTHKGRKPPWYVTYLKVASQSENMHLSRPLWNATCHCKLWKVLLGLFNQVTFWSFRHNTFFLWDGTCLWGIDSVSQVNTESYFLSKTYESYVKASFPTTILPEKAM